MLWFLERITTATLPIYFSTQEKQAHPNDFVKLIQHNILKRQKKAVDGAIYKFSNQAWLKTITHNLKITNPWDRFSDEGTYSPQAFFQLGPAGAFKPKGTVSD